MIERLLILQFDGSFRPSKDYGFPTVSESRMATCSFSLQLGMIETASTTTSTTTKGQNANTPSPHGCSQANNHLPTTTIPLALGGRSLASIGWDMTSSHVEYEGLLLGLEWLCQQLQHDQTSSSPRFGTLLPFTTTTTTPATTSLVIQGDCKTVIDQCQGKSHARKLHQKQQERVCQFIQELVNHNRFGTIRYEHIPREQNILCDAICSRIISLKEWHMLINLIDDIQQAWDVLNRIKPLTNDDPCHHHHHHQLLPPWIDDLLNGRSQNRPRRKDDARHSMIHILRHSHRPMVYSKLATLAQNVQDYSALIRIGEWMEQEAKHWPKSKATTTTTKTTTTTTTTPSSASCNDTYDSIVTQAIRYQIHGLQGLKKQKKVTELQQRHRVLLQRHADNRRREDLEYSFLDLQDLKTEASQLDMPLDSMPLEWKLTIEQWETRAKKAPWRDGSTVWVGGLS